MNAQSISKPRGRDLPAALADVALIDARTCAASGGMSVSWWHAEVAMGRAPQPVVRMPRCTRWRVTDVRAFWIAFAERAEADTEAAERLTARAKIASDRAKAKRAAKTMGNQ